jgi:hypothetical protein
MGTSDNSTKDPIPDADNKNAGVEPEKNLTEGPDKTEPVKEEKKQEDDWWTNIAEQVITLVGVVLVLAPLAFAYRALSGPRDLQVIAGIVQSDGGKIAKLTGRVVDGGVPVEKATVVADVCDSTGSCVPLPTQVSTAEGNFVFESVPMSADPTAFIKVQAMKSGWFDTKSDDLLIFPKGKKSFQITNEVITLLTVFGWFASTIAYAFFVPSFVKREHHSAYYFAVFMTFLFPIIVVGAFATFAYNRLVISTDDNSVVLLGVATVFKGTYLDTQDREWLISLTSPPILNRSANRPVSPPPSTTETETIPDTSTTSDSSTTTSDATTFPAETNTAEESADVAPTPTDAESDAKEQDPVTVVVVDESNDDGAARSVTATRNSIPVGRGFGAPLWVLFLSVVGASLFSLALVVEEIGTPPNFEDLSDVRRRVQVLVAHAFYILFAPLGGIFIYQFLILTKSADEPVMVAIAALGAGVTVNSILISAVGAARRAIGVDEARHA